jgi:hypothetical protein
LAPSAQKGFELAEKSTALVEKLLNPYYKSVEEIISDTRTNHFCNDLRRYEEGEKLS